VSNDDELDRLLREVNASLTGVAGASPPASSGQVAKATSSDPAPRGRVGSAARTGLVAGGVCGIGVGAVTFVLSWLPFIDNPVSSGLGAFAGAFLTGTALSFRRSPRS
jgi:hypothetical protein